MLNQGKNEKSHEVFINNTTPAVTMVAACNKALTGVGPSIASANQTCINSWALLPTTPMNILKVAIAKITM